MKSVRFSDSGEVLQVGKIVCIGRNYAEHAKEMMADIPQIPVIFLKPATAIIANGMDIIIPPFSKEMHHEVELVAVIGRSGKNIPESHGLEYVKGYGIGLDMTLRDVQSEAKKRGLPWSVAKGFDTSAPVSDIIAASKVGNPQRLTISCSVNGSVRQRTSTGNMIFPVGRLVEYISTVFTIEPGDLVYTGTPEGVGQVVAGDRIEASLEGFVTTSHQVVHA
jgi:2-keto-4-pentenoate hydratase/2-oxohepta-3-ene-1,7-dioic acid hydratase in catechol pathway